MTIEHLLHNAWVIVKVVTITGTLALVAATFWNIGQRITGGKR
jgi:hypothetical protein